MEQWIVGGMIVIGVAFMVVSCFIYSAKREDKDEASELIEDVGYFAIFVIMLLFFSLMVV